MAQGQKIDSREMDALKKTALVSVKEGGAEGQAKEVVDKALGNVGPYRTDQVLNALRQDDAIRMTSPGRYARYVHKQFKKVFESLKQKKAKTKPRKKAA